MTQAPFVQPAAPGDGIKWGDHKGALMLVEPKGFRAGIATAFGVTDAVEADVHVIDGPGAPRAYLSTLIFPKLLVSQTRNAVGQKVLGRLSQGNQKVGQSAPWKLEEATEADITKATEWLKTSLQPASSSGQPAQPGRQGFDDDPPF